MAFDVNTITVQGTIAVASATVGNKFVIDGCDATTDVLTQAQAAQIAVRPENPGSTTSEISLAGSTDNHVFAYAEFLQGESTGGDFNTFYLYGHLQDMPDTVVVIAVASASATTHIPEAGDVTNRTEIQFDLTFTPNADVVKVADTSMYCTRGEFLILKDRVVTTHAEGTPTIGENQLIRGLKNFAGKVYISGSADVYSVFSIETTDGGSLQFRDAGEIYAEIKNDEDTGYLSFSVVPGLDFVIEGETFAILSGEDDEIQISRPLIPHSDSGFDITLGNSGHSFVEGHIDEVYSPKLIGRTVAMQPGEVIYTFTMQVIRGVGGLIDMQEDGDDQRIALKFSPNRNTGNPMLSVLSGGTQGTSQGTEIVKFSADGCTFAGNISCPTITCPSITGDTSVTGQLNVSSYLTVGAKTEINGLLEVGASNGLGEIRPNRNDVYGGYAGYETGQLGYYASTGSGYYKAYISELHGMDPKMTPATLGGKASVPIGAIVLAMVKKDPINIAGQLMYNPLDSVRIDEGEAYFANSAPGANANTYLFAYNSQNAIALTPGSYRLLTGGLILSDGANGEPNNLILLQRIA